MLAELLPHGSELSTAPGAAHDIVIENDESGENGGDVHCCSFGGSWMSGFNHAHVMASDLTTVSHCLCRKHSLINYLSTFYRAYRLYVAMCPLSVESTDFMSQCM